MIALDQFDRDMDDVIARMQHMTAEAGGWDGIERLDGLSAIDCTDVLTGNADLAESCAWEPPTSTERAGLPGHEHLAGDEWEPLPKPKWLTENRSFAIAGALAVVGIYMGLLA